MKRFHHSQTRPLVGILTARNNNGSLIGNRLLFTKLQHKLISLGGISFIFTVDDVFSDFINGFIFVPEEEKWEMMHFPYPDIVYNRNPIRKLEWDTSFELLVELLKKKGIPFFNPRFVSKYELYCLLKDNPLLKDYFPRTILANHASILKDFLQKHQQVYLKPSLASQGKGIALMTLLNGQIKTETLKSEEIFTSFNLFWDAWSNHLISQNYLAQEAITPLLYEGNRFDFRILAHAEANKYMVTGVGIRQSQKQRITTHIPAGGKLLPYKQIQTPEHDHFFKTSVQEIGKVLTENLGFFGEFSVDAGISHSGQYYIYEVNSKPMSFDESEIEERRIEQLARIFFQMAPK